MQLQLDLARENLLAATADERVPPAGAGSAALEAVRGVSPAIGEDRHRRVGQEFVLAHEALAAAGRAGAAALPAQPVLRDAQRQIALEGLDRRISRVAHVRVHAIEAVKSTTRPHPTAERFIVRKSSSSPRV